MKISQKPRELKDTAWLWVEKDIIRMLRQEFASSPKRYRTAISVYVALAELASNSERQSRIEAYRNQISQFSAVSHTTVDRYLNYFIKLGILTKEARKINHKQNLSNRWILLSYPYPHNTGDTKDQSNHSNNDDRFTHNDDEHIEEPNKEEIALGLEQLRKKAELLRPFQIKKI